jgi:hypothetical protein
MMTDPTPRPYRRSKPVHETYSGWRITIHNGAILVARVLGVTRSHALANAALVSRAVIINDRINRILAEAPADHDHARRLAWLRQKLAE